MKKSNIFPIGSYAWKNITNYDGSYRLVKFLIVGEFCGFRALLILPPLIPGYKLKASDYIKYNIDPKYVNQMIGVEYFNNLEFYGSYCAKCLEVFDHLEPNNCFVCWNCEV